MWVAIAVLGVFLGYKFAGNQKQNTPPPSQVISGMTTDNNYKVAPVATVQPQVPAAKSVDATDQFVAPVAVDVTSEIIVSGLFA